MNLITERQFNMKDLIISIILFIGFIGIMSFGLSGLSNTQINIQKIIIGLK